MTTTPSRTGRRRRSRTRRTLAIAGAAGAAAAFAPAGLTGVALVDAPERALVAAVVAFVGAHGHRWSWFVAGALAAVPARGPAVVLVLVALAAAVASTRAPRRSLELGAVASGALANGVLWYRDVEPAALGPVLGGAALVLLVASGAPELRDRHRRTVVRLAGAVAVVLAVALAGAGWATLSSLSDVEAGSDAARAALAAVRRGDTDAAREQLATATGRLSAAHGRVGGPFALPASLVPGLAQQVRAVDVSVDEAIRVSDAADALVTTDYDQLRFREGRGLDLEAVTGLVPRSHRVEGTLRDAAAELDELRAGSLLPPLRTKIDDFAAEVADALGDTEQANAFLDVTPALLGGDGPRHYLVVFMTPAELRGAGGFVGNFAELSADGGRVRLERSGRITELIAAAAPGARSLGGPQEYLDRYGRYHPEDNLQDAAFSPHWPHDASVYAQLYPQSGGREVDGVVGVDPTGMAALLELTGPVRVEGLAVPLSADNAVGYLTRDQYLVHGDDEETREDVLDGIVRETFDRLTNASLPAPRVAGDVLGPAVRGRHLQVWSAHDAEQELFEEIGADGALRVEPGDDGLAVVQQNAGNNKLDAYLRREVDVRTTVDARDGSLRSEVTIRIHNAVPTTDLPRDVVGNNRGVPLGTNLTWVSLFTPHEVLAARLDGEPLTLGSGGEAGLRAWDTPLLQVPPGGTTTLEVELVGTVDLADGYRFRYVPQPVAEPDDVSVRLAVRSGSVAGANDGTARLSGRATEPLLLHADVRR